jgi:hypothetical protein
MRLLKTIMILLATTILVAGCGEDNWVAVEKDRIAERAMGAAPLADTYAVCANEVTVQTTVKKTETETETKTVKNCTKEQRSAADVPVGQEKQWIGAAASDSIKKCSAFIARMAYGRNASNVGFDITSIALSAAAAITVPVHSAQTLAALAGISTASKAALDADIFAQNAGPLIAQKINATYIPAIRSLLKEANAPDQQTLPNLYGELLAIHVDCSLNSALSALGGNIPHSSEKPPITMND